MRLMTILPVLALGVLSTLSLSVPAALAQEGPALNVPATLTPDDVQGLGVDFNQAFDSVPNAYLSDSMRLNYQISLLEKMTERQSELLKISDSFAAMGVPFQEPPPSKGICAQLPANAPCLKYYPELYGDIVSERKAYYDRLKAQALASTSPDQIPADTTDPKAIERARKAKAEKEKQIAEAKAAAETAERAVRYQWSDVSCAAGYCTGVVVSPKMTGFRATVKTGTRLVDGTRIEEITPRGIRVVIDGDHIDLRPSSGEGSQGTGAAPAAAALAAVVSDTPTMGAAALATQQAAENPEGVRITNVDSSGTPVGTASGNGASTPATGTGTGAAPATAAPTYSGTTPSGGNGGGASVVEPALGPSGLF